MSSMLHSNNVDAAALTIAEDPANSKFHKYVKDSKRRTAVKVNSNTTNCHKVARWHACPYKHESSSVGNQYHPKQIMVLKPPIRSFVNPDKWDFVCDCNS